MNNETLLSVLITVACVQQTGTDRSSFCSRHLHRPRHEYHLTKECTTSNMRTVASSNATELESCARLAATKNAFAFTYANFTEGSEATIIVQWYIWTRLVTMVITCRGHRCYFIDLCRIIYLLFLSII